MFPRMQMPEITPVTLHLNWVHLQKTQSHPKNQLLRCDHLTLFNMFSQVLEIFLKHDITAYSLKRKKNTNTFYKNAHGGVYLKWNELRNTKQSLFVIFFLTVVAFCSSSIAAQPFIADWGHIVFYGGILCFYWGQGSSAYTLSSGCRSILYRTVQGAQILNKEYA